MKRLIVPIILCFLIVSPVFSQKSAKFNYIAQKRLIPAEIAPLYLGIPFTKLAKQIDLKNAEVADPQFDWLELIVPYKKGNVIGLNIKIHGLTEKDKEAILKKETIKRPGEDFESEIIRLRVDKIPAKGFVYAIYVDFKPDFDLKSYVIKTYGKDGDVRKPDDPYHFYDIQWSKKTPDGLVWLIRSFHEDERRSLGLFGRIKGTEWDN